MCKYCNGEKELHLHLCTEFKGVAYYHVALIDRQRGVLRQYMRCVYPDGRVEDGEYIDFPINRCPMCGEVLSGAEALEKMVLGVAETTPDAVMAIDKLVEVLKHAPLEVMQNE